MVYPTGRIVATSALDKPSRGAQRDPMKRRSRVALALALLAATPPITADAGAGPDVAKGKKTFEGLCAQCHRADAEGMPGMGMDLRTAPLVRNGSVGAIAKFIATGHPPTEKFPLGMPPDGGESLGDADRTDVAAYLKTLVK